MRRGLQPSDLGDLFEQPLAAVISIGLADGSVFSRPVWHRWIDGKFVFMFPAGDRKISMLGRDPRATVVLAENARPYRAIEVRGRITMSHDRYHEIGATICRPYLEAFDPNADVSAYIGNEPGMIGELEAEITTCWDYADDFP
jgi:pyridoxamine 5'-phosphate oxidase-like protein